jgi:hypothetical protein
MNFDTRYSLRNLKHHDTAMYCCTSVYYVIILNNEKIIESPEDGDIMFLQNVGIYQQVHTVLQP